MREKFSESWKVGEFPGVKIWSRNTSFSMEMWFERKPRISTHISEITGSKIHWCCYWSIHKLNKEVQNIYKIYVHARGFFSELRQYKQEKVHWPMFREDQSWQIGGNSFPDHFLLQTEKNHQFLAKGKGLILIVTKCWPHAGSDVLYHSMSPWTLRGKNFLKIIKHHFV